MRFHITFLILVICASSQISAKPIDDEELPKLLGKSAEIKYNLAKTLQKKVDKGTVTNEDIDVVRSIWDLSAMIKNSIVCEMEKRLNALNITTEPTTTLTPTTPDHDKKPVDDDKKDKGEPHDPKRDVEFIDEDLITNKSKTPKKLRTPSIIPKPKTPTPALEDGADTLTDLF